LLPKQRSGPLRHRVFMSREERFFFIIRRHHQDISVITEVHADNMQEAILQVEADPSVKNWGILEDSQIPPELLAAPKKDLE
jgi:hypothetical protein